MSIQIVRSRRKRRRISLVRSAKNVMSGHALSFVVIWILSLLCEMCLLLPVLPAAKQAIEEKMAGGHPQAPPGKGPRPLHPRFKQLPEDASSILLLLHVSPQARRAKEEKIIWGHLGSRGPANPGNSASE